MDARPGAVMAAPAIWPDLIFATMLLSGPVVPFQSHCTSMAPLVLLSTAFAQAENTLPHGLCFGASVAMRIFAVGGCSADAALPTVTKDPMARPAKKCRLLRRHERVSRPT